MITTSKDMFQIIQEHIMLLRLTISQDQANFRSIYDNSIYTNLFVEDLIYFKNRVMPNSKVLDLGCGRGTSSFVLAHMGYKVEGIEVSYETSDPTTTSYVFRASDQLPLWEKTKEICENKSLNFKFYNGLELPYRSGTFDWIFAYAVIEHVEDINLTLKELCRVLKSGGRMLISRTPNKYSYTENIAKVLKIPAHDNLYSKNEIVELLTRNNFEIEFIELYDFFPARLPTKLLNNFYQKFSPVILTIEKILRKLPVKIIAHHWRIAVRKI